MRKCILVILIVFVISLPILSTSAEIPGLIKLKNGGSEKMGPNGPELKFYINKKLPSEEIIKNHLGIENLIGTHKVNDNTYNMFYVTDFIGGATPVKSLKLLRLDTDIWIVEYEGRSIILFELKK